MSNIRASLAVIAATVALSGCQSNEQVLAGSQQEAIGVATKRAQFELMPSGSGTAELLLAPVRFLVSLARRFKIDAKQERTQHCDDDRRTNGAEDVGHRVSNGHCIKELLGFFSRKREPVDSVRRKAH